MAGSTVPEIKRSIVDHLAARLPDWSIGYTWPGDIAATRSVLWVSGATVDIATTSIRSDRRRRTETVDLTLNLWVGVSDAAATSDERQEQADTVVLEALRSVDEWIADEFHLGRPDLVDLAWLRSWTLQVGPTDVGEGALISATIRYEARLL